MTASKLAQIPETHWVFDKRYNYCMTMVAGFITDEGIVVVADGRVTDKDDNVVKDDQIKIFQLSPSCAVMPSGNIPLEIGLVMEFARNFYDNQRMVSVSSIANNFTEMLNRTNDAWLMDNSDQRPQFVFAGFDLLRDGFHPKLYYILKSRGKWNWHIGGQYAPAGQANKKVRDFLEKKFDETERTFDSVNLLALKCLRIAKREKPQYVGGVANLWNIEPAKNFRKFSALEIKELEKQI